MPRTLPPARPGPSSGEPSAPRNRLGAVVFVVVVLAALLAVFPTTAGWGFLLCLLALVPAIVAYRRTRKGTATNQARSFAAVVMAPVFLIVAVVVGATTAPPRVETASDTSALAAPVVAPAAPVPLLAVPAPVPAVAVPAAESEPDPVAEAAAAESEPDPVAEAAAAESEPDPVAEAVPAAESEPDPVAEAAAAESEPDPVAEPGSDSASATCDEHTHYVASSGDCVLRPVAAASAPSGASFRCNDGTASFAEHRQGACSHHGGIAG